MNIPTRLTSSFAGLLTTLSVLGFAALLPGSAQAQSILVNATDSLPHEGTASGFYFDGDSTNAPYTNTSIDLGLFTFANTTSVDALNSLVGIQIAIELNDLSTLTAGNNQVDLTLDGIDTGISMNGYGSGNSGGTLSPGPITGISSSASYTLNDVTTTVAAAILSEFQNGGYSYSIAANGTDSGTPYSDPALSIDVPNLTSGTTVNGQLVVGITLVNPASALANNYATANSPQEVFLEGGTASLEIANYVIPFEPSQALGLGLIALCIALWFIPQTKEMMKRMFVPNRA